MQPQHGYSELASARTELLSASQRESRSDSWRGMFLHGLREGQGPRSSKEVSVESGPGWRIWEAPTVSARRGVREAQHSLWKVDGPLARVQSLRHGENTRRIFAPSGRTREAEGIARGEGLPSGGAALCAPSARQSPHAGAGGSRAWQQRTRQGDTGGKLLRALLVHPGLTTMMGKLSTPTPRARAGRANWKTVQLSSTRSSTPLPPSSSLSHYDIRMVPLPPTISTLMSIGGLRESCCAYSSGDRRARGEAHSDRRCSERSPNALCSSHTMEHRQGHLT